MVGVCFPTSGALGRAASRIALIIASLITKGTPPPADESAVRPSRVLALFSWLFALGGGLVARAFAARRGQGNLALLKEESVVRR